MTTSPALPRRPLVESTAHLLFLLAPLLVPLWISPAGEATFREPKSLLMKCLITSAWALFLLGRLQRPGRPLEGAAAWRASAVAALATLGWFGLAVAWSSIPSRSLWAVEEVAIVLAAALYAATALPAARLPGALLLFAFSAAVNGGLAALQFERVVNPFATASDARLHVTGLVGNPADLAIVLVPGLLVALFAAIYRQGAQRAIWALVAGACAYGLAGSQTLTGIVAATLGIAVLLARPWSRYKLVVAGTAAVALVAAALAVAPVRARVGKVAGYLREGKLSLALTRRGDGWLAAAAMFRARPLGGWGLGTYPSHFMRYRGELARTGGLAPDIGVEYLFFEEAHNEPLQLAAEMGVYGLAGLAAAVGLAARAARKRLANLDGDIGDFRERDLAHLLLALAVAECTFALLHFPLRLAAGALPVALALAIGAALVAPRRENEGSAA